MTIPTQMYEILVNKLVAQFQRLAGTQLTMSYRMGKIVAEFSANLDSGRYGRGVNMQLLADDLVERGVLLDVKVPIRALYYAKALSSLHKTEEELEALALQGYTISHARVIISVPEEEREAFIAAARDDQQRFLPVRQLLDRLKPAQAALVAEQTDDVEAVGASIDQRLTQPPVKPAKSAKVEPAKGSAPTPELSPDVPSTPDTPALPTPVASGEHQAATTIKDYSKPVVATLNKYQKLLDKVSTQTTDVAIVVKEVGKIGSDHPPTLKVYHDRMREIRSQVFSLIEVLRAVEQSIDEELRSHISD